VTRTVHGRADLAASRRVNVETTVPALPVVQAVALGVRQPARLGVRVADVAAVDEPHGEVLDQSESLDDLLGRPSAEADLVGRNLHVDAGVEDEPVVVPRLQGTDVLLAGLQSVVVGDDLAPRLREDVASDFGVLAAHVHLHEVVVADADLPVDVELADVVGDQRVHAVECAVAGVTLDVALVCENDH